MAGKEIAKVAAFEGKHIRKILHEGEWWFSAVDIVQVLTGSSIPKRYWSDLKRKLVKEGYFELYEKIVQLKFAAADGKFYANDNRVQRGNGIKYGVPRIHFRVGADSDPPLSQ
jgi:hypothetical protein